MLFPSDTRYFVFSLALLCATSAYATDEIQTNAAPAVGEVPASVDMLQTSEQVADTPAVVAAPVSDQTTDPAPVETPVTAEYGPVKKGETLASIAQLLAAEFQATPEQMSWALYVANPTAFEKADWTRLKAGVLLIVPSAQDIHATSPDSARAQLDRRKKEYKPALAKPRQPVDPEVSKLQADLAETRRDSEENAREQALLKRRLIEIEKEIQELLRANAERDAALRRQAAVAR